MKLIIFVLSVLLLFACLDVSAQSELQTKTVLNISKPKVQPSTLPILLVRYQQEKELFSKLYLPRIPKSYDKQYVIRVAQLDRRALRQNIGVDAYVYSAKSKDHDGYDYYLPVTFKKEEWGESFVAKLPKHLRDRAVLVKFEPSSVKCNCFGKF